MDYRHADNPVPFSKSDELSRLRTRNAELEELAERLKQEAKIHSQEARTANETIAEIYQVVSGATGEKGNWNGAEPVRQRIAELEAENARLKEESEHIRGLLIKLRVDLYGMVNERDKSDLEYQYECNTFIHYIDFLLMHGYLHDACAITSQLEDETNKRRAVELYAAGLREKVDNIANNLGEFEEAMPNQQLCDQLAGYVSELFDAIQSTPPNLSEVEAMMRDAERLKFVIDHQVTWYENHPSYLPYAICYRDKDGYRYTQIGESFISAIDAAMLAGKEGE